MLPNLLPHSILWQPARATKCAVQGLWRSMDWEVMEEQWPFWAVKLLSLLSPSLRALYIPGTRRALWDLGRLLLLMCYKSLTSLLIMQPRHIRLPVGWSVITSEKDSSASIDSIGANLFRHNMISCINVCTYHIECISRNVIKPAFQGMVGRSIKDEIK